MPTIDFTTGPSFFPFNRPYHRDVTKGAKEREGQAAPLCDEIRTMRENFCTMLFTLLTNGNKQTNRVALCVVCVWNHSVFFFLIRQVVFSLASSLFFFSVGGGRP